MAFTEYAIATGSSAATLSNIENEFIDATMKPVHFPPRADIVPPGSIVRVTLDQKVHIVGASVIRWRWSVLPYAAFSRLITKYLGGFDVDSAAVSIRTRDEENGYSNYNAVMIRPVPGEDYQYSPVRGGYVRDLTVTFRNLESY